MDSVERNGYKKRMTNQIRRFKLVILLSPAVRTRLELATPGVTGRYSNRLNYRTKKISDNLEGNFVRSTILSLS